MKVNRFSRTIFLRYRLFFWLIVITICLGACSNSSTKSINGDEKSETLKVLCSQSYQPKTVANFKKKEIYFHLWNVHEWTAFISSVLSAYISRQQLKVGQMFYP